jgi:glycosyltransferase involved in cell wall biosynthesis
MACGVPCAVTDVGDSARLVGDTGRVVPPGNASALAAACIDLLDQPPAAQRLLRARCRRRILEHFSFDQMVSRHFELWGELCGRTIHRRRATEPEFEREAA